MVKIHRVTWHEMLRTSLVGNWLNAKRAFHSQQHFSFKNRGYLKLPIKQDKPQLSTIWVNHNISLTWILRPFEDDFPIVSPTNHHSKARRRREVVKKIPRTMTFWDHIRLLPYDSDNIRLLPFWCENGDLVMAISCILYWGVVWELMIHRWILEWWTIGFFFAPRFLQSSTVES